MPDQPLAGTSTFLFTDIEGSTRLIQAFGDRYAPLLDEQRHLITKAVEDGGGRVFGSEGDALFAAFDSAIHSFPTRCSSDRRKSVV